MECDSNEAIKIHIHSKELEEFNPEFTYQLFGQNETIKGYRDLEISIHLSQCSLNQCFIIKYTEKDNSIENDFVQIKELLSNNWSTNIPELEINYLPPGDIIDEYCIAEEDFLVYKTNFCDTKCVDLMENLRILITFFIEGGLC